MNFYLIIYNLVDLNFGSLKSFKSRDVSLAVLQPESTKLIFNEGQGVSCESMRRSFVDAEVGAKPSYS